ncbi:MAG: DUF4178 domain-containing protein [Calditrichia bacterium]
MRVSLLLSRWQHSQQGQGIIAWEYIDDDDENFVSIEQWGGDDFEASQGYYVEEFMFSNILPSGTHKLDGSMDKG